MERLIAEDLLLLLLDDVRGVPRGDVPMRTLLGGALLVDLTHAGMIGFDPASTRWQRARVYAKRAGSAQDLDDPVLATALEVVTAGPGPPAKLVDPLGTGVVDQLTDRLVERGLLERRDTLFLGRFPTRRWVLVDPTGKADLRRDVTAALAQGTETDPRTTAVIALLAAVRQVHRVVDHPGLSSREVKRRAKTIGADVWAARAVRSAIVAERFRSESDAVDVGASS